MVVLLPRSPMFIDSVDSGATSVVPKEVGSLVSRRSRPSNDPVRKKIRDRGYRREHSAIKFGEAIVPLS